MKRFSTYLILFAGIFVYSPQLWADKQPTEQPLLSEPDAYITPLTPQTNLAPQKEYSFRQRYYNAHNIGQGKGIDVSHHQGNINWNIVALSNHSTYAYIKATENVSLVDKRYYQNISQAKEAGIPVGSYHFYSPNASPTTQLMNLTRTVPNLHNQDLIPLVDVEVRGRMPLSEFRSNLLQFLKGIENYYGVKPMIYTGVNFYNRYLSTGFSEYMFMIARYSNELPNLQGKPKFVIWQYSESGRIAGIRGNVDLSTFVDHYTLKDILIKYNQ